MHRLPEAVHNYTCSTAKLTSMLDLLTVGPKFMQPASRITAAAIDQYLLWVSTQP